MLRLHPFLYQGLMLITLLMLAGYSSAETTKKGSVQSSPPSAPLPPSPPLRFSSPSRFFNARPQTPVSPTTESRGMQLKQSNIGPYLGIRVDILSRELGAQLNEDILVGQGIMVSGFMQNSTAPKQGIKLYDILLTYNQQPLMHPKTFIQRISREKPGNKIQLTISRKGNIFKHSVTIGSEKVPLDEEQLDYQYNLQVLGYDGVEIKQHSKHYFEATIRYLSPDGVVRRRSFSGSFPQVQRDIYRANDLSNIAKQHLMKAISKRKSDEEGWFGDMMPFTDGFF